MSAFNLEGEGARVFRVFCTYLVFTQGLTGLIFVSNALFNNLGYPGVSTSSNLLRDVVLMLPMTLAGAAIFGAPGVLIGQQTATLSVAVLATLLSWRLVERLRDGKAMPESIVKRLVRPGSKSK